MPSDIAMTFNAMTPPDDKSDPSKHQDRFIVGSILALGITCAISATVLIFKGYNGDLIAGGVVSAISGLCGYLGARRQSSQPNVTVSGDPPKVEMGSQA